MSQTTPEELRFTSFNLPADVVTSQSLATLKEQRKNIYYSNCYINDDHRRYNLLLIIIIIIIIIIRNLHSAIMPLGSYTEAPNA